MATSAPKKIEGGLRIYLLAGYNQATHETRRWLFSQPGCYCCAPRAVKKPLTTANFANIDAPALPAAETMAFAWKLQVGVLWDVEQAKQMVQPLRQQQYPAYFQQLQQNGLFWCGIYWSRS